MSRYESISTAQVSVPYGDCSLYKQAVEDVFENGKRALFPSPMGILVFINNSFLILSCYAKRVSVPYGDSSLYKKVYTLAQWGEIVSVPYGDCSLYKQNIKIYTCLRYIGFRPLWGL